MITAERLREMLDYDPETGIFTWKVDKGRIARGSVAGNSWKGRYKRVCIDYQLYWCHALAFLWMTGSIPNIVDHINKDGNDNRWSNLREADKFQSAQNKSITVRNSSGYIGVYQCSTTGRWVSQIVANGKTEFLGRYDSPERAAKVRDLRAVELHGEFAVLNFPEVVLQ